jgi:hypothetical protein
MDQPNIERQQGKKTLEKIFINDCENDDRKRSLDKCDKHQKQYSPD